jgi:tetratricopeptide (TPR) repeat protein
LDQENAAAVAEICARLSGLPLAIVLIALLIPSYYDSPQALLDQLPDHFPYRMQIPIEGLSDSPPRHHSLSAAFESSLALLSSGACALFECLAVFVGGFTPIAVNDVCTDLLSGGDRPATGSDLKSLIAHGLVGPFSNKSRRHTMPAIIREYAAERLEASGKRAAVREWHAERFLGMLKGQAEELKKIGQPQAMVVMERELGNLRAAWEWAVEHARWKEVAHAAEPLARFYDARWRTDEGYILFRQTAERLSDLVAEGMAKGSEALHALVELLAWQGRFEPDDSVHDRLAERCQELLKGLASEDHDVRPQRALALRVFAHSPWGSKTDRGRSMLQQSLRLYRDLEDRWGQAVVLLDLGGLAWDKGKLGDAAANYEASLDHFRAYGDERGVTTCLHALHEVYGWQERREEARQAVKERMTLADEWGDVVSLVLAHEMEGSLAYIVGAYDEAVRAFERGCMGRVRELGDRAQQAYLGAWLGQAKLDSGDYAAGCAEAERSRNLGLELNYRRALSVALPVLARNALREGRHEEACRLYEETLEIAADLWYDRLRIFYEGEWAAAELQRGRRDQARQHLCVALRAAADEQSGAMPIRVLPSAALWLASNEKVEWATELYALAERYPHVANSHWAQSVFGQPLIENAKTCLSEQEIWQAKERGRARDLQATVRELLDELERSAGS